MTLHSHRSRREVGKLANSSGPEEWTFSLSAGIHTYHRLLSNAFSFLFSHGRGRPRRKIEKNRSEENGRRSGNGVLIGDGEKSTSCNYPVVLVRFMIILEVYRPDVSRRRLVTSTITRRTNNHCAPSDLAAKRITGWLLKARRSHRVVVAVERHGG